MSSGKTSALGLNQWSLSDPFLMAEMNADNAKLDAAVGVIPLSRLGQIVTTADADKIDIDLSGIDWSKYQRVDIVSRLKQNDTNGKAFFARMTVNGRNTNGDYYRRQLDYGASSDWSSSLILASSSLTNPVNLPCHHVSILSIYPEEGCYFQSADDGISDTHCHCGSILRSSTGSTNVAAIGTLQYLSFAWAPTTDATAVTKLSAGCKFTIFGVAK